MQLRKRKTELLGTTLDTMKVARNGFRTMISEHFRTRSALRAPETSVKKTVTKLTASKTSIAVSVEQGDVVLPKKVKSRRPAMAPVGQSAAAAASSSVKDVTTRQKVSQKRQRAVEAKGFVSQSEERTAAPDLFAPVLPALAPERIAIGAAHIASKHPRLAELVAEYGMPKSLVAKQGSTFASLAHTIVSQQLATGAARTIFGRFLVACKCETEVTPEAVLAVPLDELRSCGLSGQKAAYITDLANHYADGRLSDAMLQGMSEVEVVQRLTQVKGIGPWTADMFCMFFAGRPDVLPVGDLGVRKGFQLLFSLKTLPDAAQMEELAGPWRPWRSIGAWYMWRLTEAEGRKVSKKNVKKAAVSEVSVA